ncbi:DELTA-stichotoxin-Hmg2b-like [Pseudoliparis swirei]|uniref:DELTA-stichotoxin-Hmg2b-like n=1 Tax=Pseudoliparis swirei TaxID=2059687 RepID=UPI0024BEA8C3|nr:DELTA-stichotoxin-Hmg2b-like [Pseudoliparis swirei]
MSESAEASATDLANLGIGRSVEIEITNQTNVSSLINPGFYLFSGNCQIPPQPTVSPQKAEMCKFSMVTGLARGAVGVLTYDFKRQSDTPNEKLAIMFSVPFNYIADKNILAIGIYAGDKECNKALYNEMYYGVPYHDKEMHGFVRKAAKEGSLTFEGCRFHIKAIMSPVGGSVLKVEVWDKPRDD